MANVDSLAYLPTARCPCAVVWTTVEGHHADPSPPHGAPPAHLAGRLGEKQLLGGVRTSPKKEIPYGLIPASTSHYGPVTKRFACTTASHWVVTPSCHGHSNVSGVNQACTWLGVVCGPCATMGGTCLFCWGGSHLPARTSRYWVARVHISVPAGTGW